MCNSLLKRLFMIIVLLTFTGQTVAYHFSTLAKAPSHEATKQQQLVDIDLLDSISGLSSEQAQLLSEHSSVEDDCCDVDCCENECFCPTNACAATLYLASEPWFSKAAMVSELALPLIASKTSFITSALYRPPILTA